MNEMWRHTRWSAHFEFFFQKNFGHFSTNFRRMMLSQRFLNLWIFPDSWPSSSLWGMLHTRGPDCVLSKMAARGRWRPVPVQSRKKCNQVGVSHVSIIHFLPWRNVCSFISLLRPLNCAAGSVFLFARAPSTGARASNFKLPAADNFPRKKNFFERKKFPENSFL